MASYRPMKLRSAAFGDWCGQEYQNPEPSITPGGRRHLPLEGEGLRAVLDHLAAEHVVVRSRSRHGSHPAECRPS